MEDNDVVNHPSHYTTGFETKSVECIDITRHMSFCTGNAFKYVWRAGLKGGDKKELEDLKKAKWYLNDVVCHEGGSAYQVATPAQAAFGFLVSDGSQKYEILRLIVNGSYAVAHDFVEALIEEIEDEGNLG